MQKSLFVFTVGMLLAASPVRAGVILSDNFDDNSLNTGIWSTALPFGSSSVVEQNQRIELRNRGHLRTLQEFDPLSVGPLLVTGTWTYIAGTGSSLDFMEIWTRSDGSTSGPNGSGGNGIVFRAHPSFGSGGKLQINKAVAGSETPLGAEQTMDIFNGETFQFSIFDDGTNLSFQMTQVGGDGSTGFISATDSTDFSKDHVVFHNREFNNSQATLSYLDDVTITTAVPEPSSLTLFGIAIACLFSYGYRRRKKSSTLS